MLRRLAPLLAPLLLALLAAPPAVLGQAWLGVWEIDDWGTCTAYDLLQMDSSTEGSCVSLPDCEDAAGNHLNYDLETGAFSCGTSSSATDTGPSPDCSGTLTYQDGEGGCDTYTLSGNTTALTTASGVLTSGDCVEFDASGNVVASGAACGTDTNADTICSGTTTYLDGEGTCDTLDGLEDFETATASAVYIGNGTTFSASVIPDCDTGSTEKLMYDTTTRAFTCVTDWSALTICSTGSSFLNGNGTCSVLDSLEDFETPTDDAIPVGNASSFDMKVMPDCDTGGMGWDQGGRTFSCNDIPTVTDETTGWLVYSPFVGAQNVGTSFTNFAILYVTGNKTTYNEFSFNWSGTTAGRTYEWQLLDEASAVVASGSRASTFTSQDETTASFSNIPTTQERLLFQLRVTASTGDVVLNAPPVLEMQ